MKRFPICATVSLAIPLLLASSVARAAEEEQDRGATTDKYLKSAFGPTSVVRDAAGAAIEQKMDNPHEWGQGAAGFGRRFASAFGKHIVDKSIHFAVAKMRHEEFGYHASGKEGFGPRLKYALASVIITHKTTNGKATVAAGELSGAFGSGLISRAWQPASTGSLATGFASGGITLGIDAGSHVLREFWPEIRHPRRHHSEAKATAVAEPVVAEEEE
jgi:hypothetical protein